MTTVISLKDLLEAGCHFGHQVRRWNPRMKPYLYAKREGLHIFDLVKTKEGLEEACAFMHQAAIDGKRIVFVATKRQAQSIVKDAAKRAGVAFVTERWLGGLMTNHAQIKQTIDKVNRLKKQKEAGGLKNYTKKERLLIARDIAKFDRFLGGLIVYDSIPEIMFVIDSRREKVAIEEAKRMGMSIVGIVDSNGDPSGIDHVIPANDDAVKSIQLIVGKIADAIIEGKKSIDNKETKTVEKKIAVS